MTRDIPRLEMENLAPGLAAALAPRVDRLGYLGEFFKCMGHQPEALQDFMNFTESSKGDLPKNIVELVALSVSGALNNAYERHQHERLSLKLELGKDWVAAVNLLRPNYNDVLNSDEQRVQTLALAMVHSGGHGTNDLIGDVVEAMGPTKAAAVLLLIGRYVTHAYIVNGLELAPPVASIFEDA